MILDEHQDRYSRGVTWWWRGRMYIASRYGGNGYPTVMTTDGLGMRAAA